MAITRALCDCGAPVFGGRGSETETGKQADTLARSENTDQWLVFDLRELRDRLRFDNARLSA